MTCGAKPKIIPNSNVDYPKVNRWHLHKTLEKGGQISVQQFNLSLYCGHVNKEKMTLQWKKAYRFCWDIYQQHRYLIFLSYKLQQSTAECVKQAQQA